MRSSIIRFLVTVVVGTLALGSSAVAGERWSAKRAADWYAKQPWLVGSNYTPRTAINQLEFWQADTFDPKTIDQELGWAASLGMNVMRVYLHDIVHRDDAAGLYRRMDRFLAICDKHGITVMFVLLDDCWNPEPKAGKQPAPKPHLHNSGWVQSPGAAILSDPNRHDEMKPYVQGVLKRFRDDKRVLCWDLYNEPGNDQNRKFPGKDPAKKDTFSIRLLQEAFDWAREVNPNQPLTVGVWAGNWSDPNKLSPINKVCVERSDVMTFHSYGGPKSFEGRAKATLQYARPVICTEYLNRPGGNTFQNLLPQMKKHRIGAINWGLVAGKIQTQYPWASWRKKFTAEPEVWFHDVLRPDGTPFDEAEAKLIRKLTGRGDRESKRLGP